MSLAASEYHVSSTDEKLAISDNKQGVFSSSSSSERTLLSFNLQQSSIQEFQHSTSSKKHKIGQSIDLFTSYRRNSGIVRANWYDSNHKLSTISYGTGYAITKRVILTCAHTLCLQSTHQLCDSVDFFLESQGSGTVPSKKIYKSAQKNFIHLEEVDSRISYDTLPLQEQICLFLLEEQIDQDLVFPQVGVYSREHINQNNLIEISGFPSKIYSKTVDWNKVNPERSTLSGPFININDFKIFHDLDTRIGHSGSAILGLTQNFQVIVLGIHTHKGTLRNTGIFLTRTILERLEQYETKFVKEHNIERQINFPKQIKGFKIIHKENLFIVEQGYIEEEEKAEEKMEQSFDGSRSESSSSSNIDDSQEIQQIIPPRRNTVSSLIDTNQPGYEVRLKTSKIIPPEIYFRYEKENRHLCKYSEEEDYKFFEQLHEEYQNQLKLQNQRDIYDERCQQDSYSVEYVNQEQNRSGSFGNSVNLQQEDLNCVPRAIQKSTKSCGHEYKDLQKDDSHERLSYCSISS